jgi:hypothetical protein
LLGWGVTGVVTVSDRLELRDDVAAIVDRYVLHGLTRATVWVDTAAAIATRSGGP